MAGEELPVEAMLEILSWLPLKPLIRFKSISKKYLILLSADPHFSRLHLHRSIQSNPDPSIMILYKNIHADALEYYYIQNYNACNHGVLFKLPFYCELHFIRLYGICDGLLCLGSSSIESSNVYVWNPLTGEYVTIACTPVPSRYLDYHSASVLFGFGCYTDSGNNNVYKVIRILNGLMDVRPIFQSDVRVYTLGTDSWRSLPDLTYDLLTGNQRIVFVNGALHWFAARRPLGTFHWEAVIWDVILSFDLKDEIFLEIPMPEGVVYDHRYPNCITVGELGGLLCMICNLSDGNGLHVWVMQEYGVVDSWTERIVIIPPAEPVLRSYLYPLGVVNNGEIIMKKGFGCGLVVYNPETKAIRDHYMCPMYGEYTFRGSIISPRVISGVKDVIDIEEYGKRNGILPVGLLKEVLSWLPVKTLLRFKCVRKRCREIITSDLHLPMLHLHRVIQPNPIPNILILRSLTKLSFYYAEDYKSCDDAILFEMPLDNSYSLKIFGICHGLLCLGNSSPENSTLYLWNPLTGDHDPIYCPPILARFSDLKYTTAVYGFGHQDGNVYKVIRILNSYSDDHLTPIFQKAHVNVYTLGTWIWRTLSDAPYNISPSNISNALVNGAIHWFAARTGVKPLSWNVIVSFDLKHEVFVEIPQPEGVYYNFDCPNKITVRELGGLLSMFCDLGGEFLHVWVMKEYGVVESWTKQFVIGPPEIPQSAFRLSIIGAVNSEVTIIQKNPLELVVYNHKTNSVSDLYHSELEMYEVYTYRASIISPKSINSLRDIEEDRLETKEFPLEMVKEILSWLPVKPLLRFKCVSRRWHKLITDDLHFSVLHLHRSIQLNSNPNILILRSLSKLFFYYAEDYKSCDDAVLFQMPFDCSHSLEIFGICHGILCLGNSSPDSSTLYLWNPLTRDHDPIYCPPVPARFSDNNNITAVYGFGYHQDADVYKVIRILNSYSEDHSKPSFQKAQVDVYTVGTWIWRALCEAPYNISRSNISNALVNGAIHWVAARTGVEPLAWNIIVAFDLKHDVFLEISQPEGVSYNFNSPNKITVGELGGLLSMFCDIGREFLHVWVMKEYGVVESWTKQFAIGPPEIPQSAFHLSIIGAANSDETIIQKNPMDLIVYNSKSNSASDLYSSELVMHKVFTFGGSLISPTIINGNGSGDMNDTEESGSEDEGSSSELDF